ncbi:MAG: DUF433 domain-containing protein [Ilumatobacteraceae bacterium]
MGSQASATEELLHALRHPRGRYTAERAAQLSGIPRSTLYDWQRLHVYVPDFPNGHPMGWSYRDLVYVRVLAWLRNDVKTPRPVAAARVRTLKEQVAAGRTVTVLQADKETLAADGNASDPVHGESRLFVDMLHSFDLTAAVEDFGRHERLWGPNLVTPSRHTHISPWVLGGDPCVENTRIPTSAIYVLRTERGLSADQIADLYPGLDPDKAVDAYELETRLRGPVDLAA